MEDKTIVYRSPDSESELTRLAFYRIGFSRTFPQFHITRPVKYVYTLKIVVAGRGVIRSHAQQQTFKAGDIVLYWKGYPYEWWTDPQDLLRHYWIDIEGSLAPELFAKTGADAGHPVLERAFMPPEEAALAEELLKAYADNSAGSYWRCFSLFFAVWRSVIASLPPARSSSNVRSIAANARAFIDMHYTSSITLRDIAASVGVAPGYLSAVYQAEYGISPYADVIRRRLQMAHHLLSKGCSVQVAANSVGYADTGYFARLFRRHYGCTPSSVITKI